MLTSLQNPLVKQLRKLHQAKERHSQGLCLLEGTHLLEEACAARYPLITVCVTPSWQVRYPLLWEQALQQAERVEVVSEAILEAIATTVHPDGVVATAHRETLTQPIQPSISLGLVLERVQDPGNLGTIIRTAAATHVEGLWLSPDSVDLDHPKVMRATAGQWFRLPMCVSENLQQTVEQAKAAGLQVVATLPNATQTFWEIDLTRPSLILVGNEGAGLSSSLADTADVNVQIPLAAGVESLNVAIATALILYEVERQRTRGYSATGIP